MRVAISWFIIEGQNDNVTEGRMEGKATFPDLTSDQKYLDVIQEVVSSWEGQGTTIDQGGDDEWYELTLPDLDPGDPEHLRRAAKLLSEVEQALTKL